MYNIICIATFLFVGLGILAGKRSTIRNEYIDMRALTAKTNCLMMFLLGDFLLCRRYSSAVDIPSSMYQKNKTLHGRVIAVADSDNLRIIHKPFLWRLFPPFSSKNESLWK